MAGALDDLGRRRASALGLVGLGAGALLVVLARWPGQALAALRFLDSGICAQLPTHILNPGGVPLPLCARNTGIYSGAALALTILWFSGRGRAMLPPPPRVIATLLAAIGVMAVDGFNSVAADLGAPHLYTPNNALRLATGLAAGIALALLIAPVVARAVCGTQDARPSLNRMASLIPYAGAGVAAFAVIWARPAWALYPIAFGSNGGLLGILAEINLIAILVLARTTGSLVGTTNTQKLAAAATVVGMTELLALATVRGMLLGSASL